jgi:hypothetical protein
MTALSGAPGGHPTSADPNPMTVHDPEASRTNPYPTWTW